MDQHDSPTAVTEAFAGLIAPRRRNPDRDPVENADYAAMLLRMIRALEYRAIEDPAILPLVVELEGRMREVANVAIAVNAARYAVDPHSAASMAECARALGISTPSASERRKIGNRIIDARVEAAGAAKFSEAKRERDIITAAEDRAVVSMAEYRARHAKVA